MAFMDEFRSKTTLFYWGWGQDTDILNYCPQRFSHFILVDTGMHFEDTFETMYNRIIRSNTEESWKVQPVKNKLKYCHPISPLLLPDRPGLPFTEGQRAEAALLTSATQKVLVVHAEGIMFFLNKFINSECFVLKKNNFDAWEAQIDPFLHSDIELKLIDQGRLLNYQGRPIINRHGAVI